MLYDVRWDEKEIPNEGAVETPLKEFVEFGKYYLCRYEQGKLSAEYMDIIPDGDSVKLSKKQGASMIDASTQDRMDKYFQANFSLHSLNDVNNDGLTEIVDVKITDDK